MLEEKVRPTELMKRHRKLFESDVSRLLDQKAKFARVDCPACASERAKPVFEKESFAFESCSHCSTVFVNPRPTYSQLIEYYSEAPNIQFWNQEIFPASEAVRREHIFVPRVEKVAALVKSLGIKTDTLVDVGAGFGIFGEEILKRKIFSKVIAIEPSKEMAETCRKKGLEVFEGPVEEFASTTCSVVTCFELIEHLHTPQLFVKSCHDILAPGGYFIITTPNVDSFECQTLGKKSQTFAGPNHLNYFHPHSIRLLLDRCGFDVVEITTPGKLDVELVGKAAERGDFDLSNNPFLDRIYSGEPALRAEFQDWLVRSELSSHMAIVARKRA